MKNKDQSKKSRFWAGMDSGAAFALHFAEHNNFACGTEAGQCTEVELLVAGDYFSRGKVQTWKENHIRRQKQWFSSRVVFQAFFQYSAWLNSKLAKKAMSQLNLDGGERSLSFLSLTNRKDVSTFHIFWSNLSQASGLCL